jgi:superoxide dismutase, Fe-Mn family
MSGYCALRAKYCCIIGVWGAAEVCIESGIIAEETYRRSSGHTGAAKTFQNSYIPEETTTMPIQLPDLPFEPGALEPHMSGRTLEFHHGKHHQAYVTKYNELVKGTPYDDMPLEEVIREVASDPAKKAIFNNGAQAWNHTFFWECLRPGGGGKPGRALAEKIDSDLGGMDKFAEAFKTAAVGQFGSGWAWLVLEKGKLKITTTANADTPLVHGQSPLFTVDVWEHAYYLDYQNRRPDFVAAMLASVADWDFVEMNLRNASS